MPQVVSLRFLTLLAPARKRTRLAPLVLLLLAATVAAAAAKPRKAAAPAPRPPAKSAPAAAQAVAKPSTIARLGLAVEGAESSYGTDPRMWRGDPAAPQGPMQVTAAAATDVGGGDRFDPAENVALGRAYLADMYRRFGSWPDAVAAYNWGPGRLDFWIRSGRSPFAMPPAVERYRIRVLVAAGLPLPPGAEFFADWPAALRRMRLGGIVHPQPRRTGIAARAGIGDAEIASLYRQVMQASAPGSR
jgi:hypothetical protein